MIQIQKTALVPYPNHDMFVLVNDIAGYPQFLPWCKSIIIHSQTDTDIIATINMSGIGLGQSFTTTNVIKPNEFIEMRLLKGPFKHLYGKWNFHQLGADGCKICLDLEFAISNSLLRVSLEPIFTKISNNLVDAFVQQANKLYGKP